MNTADILHDTAMDYYDLGKIAKAKGKNKVYEDYINKAFVLDKEAAIKKYQDVKDDFWKYVYLRSAAWLALDCGKLMEAEKLAEFGLQGNPPETEMTQFLEILKKVKSKNKSSTINENQHNDLLRTIGILTSADTLASFIVINGGQPSPLKISVPSGEVDNLVKMYWGKTVEISGVVRKDGKLELKHIKKAA